MLGGRRSGILLINLVANGNFANGTTGWVNEGSTNAVTSNILSNTGNGTSIQPDIYTNIGAKIIGRNYYLKAAAMVTNAACTVLSIASLNIAQNISNPIQNQWYQLSGIITATSIYQYLLIRHKYADSATANGKIMQVQNVMAFDVTDFIAAGRTQADIENMLANCPAYFGGNFIL